MTFALVAKPWLIRRQGGCVHALPRFPVQADFELPRPGTREEFLRVRLTGAGTSMRATLTGSQSSGVLSSLSQAEGIAVIAPGVTVAVGDWLPVIPVSALLARTAPDTRLVAEATEDQRGIGAAKAEAV